LEKLRFGGLRLCKIGMFERYKQGDSLIKGRSRYKPQGGSPKPKMSLKMRYSLKIATRKEIRGYGEEGNNKNGIALH